MFSTKYFLSGGVFGLILLMVYFFSLPDGKLHIVFCDVGQGDAAYIRTGNGQDMLIDGGPNDKVLTCLGNNMPFYDRTIDVVLLTHPQKDHLQGLISVLERYSVKYFVIGVEGNNTEGYRKLADLIKNKGIIYKNLYQGDNFLLGDVRMNVLWPEKKWVADRIQSSEFRIQNVGVAVLGMSTDTNINDFSYYLHLSYGEFDALFSGDGDSRIQPEVMLTANLPDVELLKFPHHGSKTGILPEFLDKIKPETAVISSGKNPWGHPTKEALQLLVERGINILRTDKEGDIEFQTDGTHWGLN
ncbi:hypothetical protein A2W14_05100 [Candidatus Gottesmanbacteria bacterium RBG_16_37_8]|uniref:Metallo-beta-lactamase domain-containing protein n=1 Tax=Candidatus Gottesmanbacteria bacterium RBG_16_37_8 TaxID=1798371 RepID=A0A1F5YUF7_9BACT|nr:MAG: hypothetical protein A2W14_05100 [Candidatus Gottesmanbacteria bacterium RBG_16_37_8]